MLSMYFFHSRGVIVHKHEDIGKCYCHLSVHCGTMSLKIVSSFALEANYYYYYYYYYCSITLNISQRDFGRVGVAFLKKVSYTLHVVFIPSS